MWDPCLWCWEESNGADRNEPQTISWVDRGKTAGWDASKRWRKRKQEEERNARRAEEERKKKEAELRSQSSSGPAPKQKAMPSRKPDEIDLGADGINRSKGRDRLQWRPSSMCEVLMNGNYFVAFTLEGIVAGPSMKHKIWQQYVRRVTYSSLVFGAASNATLPELDNADNVDWLRLYTRNFNLTSVRAASVFSVRKQWWSESACATFLIHHGTSRRSQETAMHLRNCHHWGSMRSRCWPSAMRTDPSCFHCAYYRHRVSQKRTNNFESGLRNVMGNPDLKVFQPPWDAMWDAECTINAFKDGLEYVKTAIVWLGFTCMVREGTQILSGEASFTENLIKTMKSIQEASGTQSLCPCWAMLRFMDQRPACRARQDRCTMNSTRWGSFAPSTAWCGEEPICYGWEHHVPLHWQIRSRCDLGTPWQTSFETESIHCVCHELGGRFQAQELSYPQREEWSEHRSDQEMYRCTFKSDERQRVLYESGPSEESECRWEFSGRAVDEAIDLDRHSARKPFAKSTNSFRWVLGREDTEYRCDMWRMRRSIGLGSSALDNRQEQSFMLQLCSQCGISAQWVHTWWELKTWGDHLVGKTCGEATMDEWKVSWMERETSPRWHAWFHGDFGKMHAHRQQRWLAEVEERPSQTGISLRWRTRRVPPCLQQNRPEALRSVRVPKTNGRQRRKEEDFLPVDLWWWQRHIRWLREEDSEQRRLLATLWMDKHICRHDWRHLNLWVLDGNVHVRISVSRHLEWLGIRPGRLPTWPWGILLLVPGIVKGYKDSEFQAEQSTPANRMGPRRRGKSVQDFGRAERHPKDHQWRHHIDGFHPWWGRLDSDDRRWGWWRSSQRTCQLHIHERRRRRKRWWGWREREPRPRGWWCYNGRSGWGRKNPEEKKNHPDDWSNAGASWHRWNLSCMWWRGAMLTYVRRTDPSAILPTGWEKSLNNHRRKSQRRPARQRNRTPRSETLGKEQQENACKKTRSSPNSRSLCSWWTLVTTRKAVSTWWIMSILVSSDRRMDQKWTTSLTWPLKDQRLQSCRTLRIFWTTILRRSTVAILGMPKLMSCCASPTLQGWPQHREDLPGGNCSDRRRWVSDEPMGYGLYPHRSQLIQEDKQMMRNQSAVAAMANSGMESEHLKQKTNGETKRADFPAKRVTGSTLKHYWEWMDCSERDRETSLEVRDGVATTTDSEPSSRSIIENGNAGRESGSRS